MTRSGGSAIRGRTTRWQSAAQSASVGRAFLAAPAGQPAGPADRAQPPLGLRPRAPGRDQQRLVAAHEPGGVVGHEGPAVADDEHDGGVLGQPQLRQVDAVQPRAGRHGHLQQVGVQLVERRGLDLDVPRA